MGTCNQRRTRLLRSLWPKVVRRTSDLLLCRGVPRASNAIEARSTRRPRRGSTRASSLFQSHAACATKSTSSSWQLNLPDLRPHAV
jgi:hypothetical protein